MKNRSTMIWGIIFLVIGLGLILKVVFQIDLPIFKILIAAFFIYIGIKVLIGDSLTWRATKTESSVIFAEGSFSSSDGLQKEYNAIFGKIELDMRNVDLSSGNKKVTVNAVFGAAEIFIDKNIPYKVKSDVAFGGARLPDGSTGGFGSSSYNSDSLKSDQNYLYIEANAVFGSVEIRPIDVHPPQPTE